MAPHMKEISKMIKKMEKENKYCSKCVIEHYRNKDLKGKKKFIDPKHNLLFFKTRKE